MTYDELLQSKTQEGVFDGFDPLWMPSFLFDFQRSLVDWAVRKGQCAIFADCGLGKTPMQLAWAENVVRKTNKPVLIITPLAVSGQTVREAEKFSIEAHQSRDGKSKPNITVTNYERLHHFNRDEFGGIICDESSILKNFDGATKAQVTEFMRKSRYRLLCTATAAPNDYIELGTSSEAIGELPHLEMLKRFFVADDGSYAHGGSRRTRFQGWEGKFRFRGHAERHFWRWVCSWARAVRKPSDLGFCDGSFSLPDLRVVEHIVRAKTRRDGWLIDLPAMTLEEQRDERRRTLNERCEQAASLIANSREPAVAWCHLNDEGHLLERLIPGAVEIEGADSDERKEEVFDAFASGQIRVLVSKPVIAGFGLNWQHCAHETFFPSHSFEQWYQAVRRCWRFGQKNPVRVDVISSEGEAGVLANLTRKAKAAEEMFARLVELMNNELRMERTETKTQKQEMPVWL